MYSNAQPELKQVLMYMHKKGEAKTNFKKLLDELYLDSSQKYLEKAERDLLKWANIG